ncbi:MAG: hypothetical protein Q8Q73_08405 [Stagnimonas sp.]|nr:hypothetical protein [Stagnimonas sp.]
MELSLKQYAGKCVHGAEVFYVLFVLGGFLPMRSAAGVELHHKIFETLPAFVWISIGSFALGAVYVFAFAWIFGAYFVGMHNSSLISGQLAR